MEHLPNTPSQPIESAKATYELCMSVGVIISTQGPAPPAATTTPAPEPTETEGPPSYGQPTTYELPPYAPAVTTVQTSTYAANATSPAIPPPYYTGGAVA